DWLRRNAATLTNATARDETCAVPQELAHQLASQGLIGLQLDPVYGGLGLGNLDAARVLEQLAAIDFSTSIVVALNNYLGLQAILEMRLGIGAVCIGGMKRCAQLVSRDRIYQPQRNGKATPNPVILSRLGSAAARVTALECLVHGIARATDAGLSVPAEGFAA